MRAMAIAVGAMGMCAVGVWTTGMRSAVRTVRIFAVGMEAVAVPSVPGVATGLAAVGLTVRRRSPADGLSGVGADVGRAAARARCGAAAKAALHSLVAKGVDGDVVLPGD